MLLAKQMSFKMATNGFQSNTSNFSIEHILNRAGEQFSIKRKSKQFETVSMNSSGSSSGDESNGCENYERNLYQDRFAESERFMEIPAFDWLNYTRYNMPRLPRPTKGPAKRTPGRLPRIPFTPYQLSELENAFTQATYLSTEDANKLAKRLELTGVRVKIWFQNRRARDRRERRDLGSKTIKHQPSDNDDNDEEIIVS